jgi:hypothetical protein
MQCIWLNFRQYIWCFGSQNISYLLLTFLSVQKQSVKQKTKALLIFKIIPKAT